MHAPQVLSVNDGEWPVAGVWIHGPAVGDAAGLACG